jgi:opacity protein-like surface antigen
MRKFTMVTGALLGAVLVLGSADQAQAQWGIAPYVGYNLDAEEMNLGAAVQFALPAKIGGSALVLSPSFDFYPFMGETVQGVELGASLYTINFDMHYPFPVRSALKPYVGAGLALVHASVSIDDPVFGNLDVSDTDIGLNLKGGLSLSAGPLRPFAEGVLVVSSGSTFVLRGGLMFAFK